MPPDLINQFPSMHEEQYTVIFAMRSLYDVGEHHTLARPGGSGDENTPMTFAIAFRKKPFGAQLIIAQHGEPPETRYPLCQHSPWTASGFPAYSEKKFGRDGLYRTGITRHPSCHERGESIKVSVPLGRQDARQHWGRSPPNVKKATGRRETAILAVRTLREVPGKTPARETSQAGIETISPSYGA